MRVILGLVLTLASGPAMGCSTTENVLDWMRAQWPMAAINVLDAGADTAAIADGISRNTQRRMSPEVRFVVAIPMAADFVIIAAVSQGCLADYGTVSRVEYENWLERSRL